MAHILEHLKPWLHCRSKVLDIGSGSGYLSALFAYMGAKVVCVEHVRNLCKRAMKNIRRGAPALALADNFHFVCKWIGLQKTRTPKLFNVPINFINIK